ncbi:MAG: hypothetical protein JRJ12_04010 [Deltaproteobacteria bacterium]|nr:hypothetical protein [Deltaproteobacteria bacterium]MBW2070950.1 hypothetical protein [Deltaproteobacteria bacterium]
MIEINLTIVIQVVQFLILVLILNKILFKPINEVISERQQQISTWEEKAHQCREQVRTKLQQYEDRLQQTKVSAHQQQEEVTKKLKEQQEEKLRQVAEESARIIDSTQQQLRAETQRIRDEIRREVDALSEMLAAKVLGREVS